MWAGCLYFLSQALTARSGPLACECEVSEVVKVLWAVAHTLTPPGESHRPIPFSTSHVCNVSSLKDSGVARVNWKMAWLLDSFQRQATFKVI